MADVVVAETRPIVTPVEAKSLGLKRYFLGTACRKGHIDERLVSSRSCVACHRSLGAAWRADNPDETRAIRRRAYLKNPGYFREYRDKNRDKVASVQSQWYISNRSKVLEKAAEWDAAHPVERKVISHRYRASTFDADGQFSASDVFAILVLQDNSCAGCGADVAGDFTIDHVTPLSKGGGNDPSNIQIMCLGCNSSKGALTMVEWLARRNQHSEA